MYDSVGFLFTFDSAIYAEFGYLYNTPFIGAENQLATIYAYTGILDNAPLFGVKVIEGSTGPTAPKQRWISSF